MERWLVDRNVELVKAGQKESEGIDEVYIECGSILNIAENTVVSPANSYGFLRPATATR